MYTDDLTEEFSLDPALIYLNHAAVAPWPRRTTQAVQRFAQENAQRGAQHYPDWASTEQQLRTQLAHLIGARSEAEIALLKSTSEGLSVIAHGLPWQAGDSVVIPAQEFPSNRIVWESLARYGVEVRAVDIRHSEQPEVLLLSHIDSTTRLLSVSSVQYDTGLRLDLQHLGRACEAQEVLFCVDAIQSLGVIPLDVRAIRADFVVADGHKWLLGPEGLALFYCRRELLERLQLHQYGWHMVEQLGDFERRDWQPAHSARRFECGSPNMLGIHALHASLSLIEQIGVQNISEIILKNTAYLIELFELKKQEFEIITPRDRVRHAGIFSVRPRQDTPEQAQRKLQAQGVICAVRGGALRLSPHIHTREEQLTATLQYLA